jgi:hypothetical protein
MHERRARDHTMRARSVEAAESVGALPRTILTHKVQWGSARTCGFQGRLAHLKLVRAESALRITCTNAHDANEYGACQAERSERQLMAESPTSMSAYSYKFFDALD